MREYEFEELRSQDYLDACAEQAHEVRVRNSLSRCQCGYDLPGYCPGPTNCPYSGIEEGEEENEDYA